METATELRSCLLCTARAALRDANYDRSPCNAAVPDVTLPLTRLCALALLLG